MIILEHKTISQYTLVCACFSAKYTEVYWNIQNGNPTLRHSVNVITIRSGTPGSIVAYNISDAKIPNASCFILIDV